MLNLLKSQVFLTIAGVAISGALVSLGVVGVPPELISVTLGTMIVPSVIYLINNYRTVATGNYDKAPWQSTRFRQNAITTMLATPALAVFLSQYGVDVGTIMALLGGTALTSATHVQVKTGFDLKRLLGIGGKK